MTTDRAQQDWPRAGRIVRERMAEQGIDQVELSRRSGVSDHTIRALTRGVRRAYQGKRLGALSRALGWPPHTIERLSQGEPQPRDIDYLDRDALRRQSSKIRDALDGLDELIRSTGRG